MENYIDTVSKAKRVASELKAMETVARLDEFGKRVIDIEALSESLYSLIKVSGALNQIEAVSVILNNITSYTPGPTEYKDQQENNA
jgi:hypothetical protein